jgi:hypothetical protein
VTFRAVEPGTVEVTQRLCGTPRQPSEGADYRVTWSVGHCPVELRVGDTVHMGVDGVDHSNDVYLTSDCTSGTVQLPWDAVTFAGAELTVRITAANLSGMFADMLLPGTAWSDTGAANRGLVTKSGGYGGLVGRVEVWDQEGYDTAEGGATFLIPRPE